MRVSGAAALVLVAKMRSLARKERVLAANGRVFAARVPALVGTRRPFARETHVLAVTGRVLPRGSRGYFCVVPTAFAHPHDSTYTVTPHGSWNAEFPPD